MDTTNSDKVYEIGEVDLSEYLSLNEIVSKYNLSPVYVRRMVQKGKLITIKVKIRNNTFKHYILKDVVESWRNKSREGGSRREDGRNKYTLYGNKEEIEKIEKLLKDNLPNVILIRTNKIKISETTES